MSKVNRLVRPTPYILDGNPDTSHMRSKRTKGVKRILRHLFVAVAVAASMVAVIVWLVFQHKPAWYHPAIANETTFDEARRGSAAVIDATSRRLVKGDPFEVVLLQKEVNQWLTAWPHLSPEAERGFPREIHDLAVAFEPDLVRVGALYESGGWKTIVNFSMTMQVARGGHSIRFHLVEAWGGSLSMPDWLLARILTPWLRSASKRPRVGKNSARTLAAALSSIQSVDELRQGIEVRNDFVWPNGQRPGRVHAVEVRKGELRLGIEPR